MGSAHTHSDQNSFCLQDQGKLIFVDSGRYTYRETGERSVLKSAWSHTGCILDETPPEMSIWFLGLRKLSTIFVLRLSRVRSCSLCGGQLSCFKSIFLLAYSENHHVGRRCLACNRRY